MFGSLIHRRCLRFEERFEEIEVYLRCRFSCGGDLRECGAGVVHPMARLLPLPADALVVAGTLAGCLVQLAGVTLPVAELVIAATVLLLGDIIATNRELPALMLAVLFAGAGLFLGRAYGESIFGAEQTPLIAYLAGFTLVQLVVAVLAGLVTRWVIASDAARPMKVRLAGAVVSGIGLALFVGHVESVLFPGVQ